MAIAQITPAAGYTPPDDTPSIRVGHDDLHGLHLSDAPEIRDADGNTIHPNAFNVTRSYINVTGNLSHIVAFRVTPDIVRQSGLITLVPPEHHHERQPGVPHQVRIRAIQPGRLDDQGIVGAFRHSADAVSRLLGKHLPVPVSGHDVHRARRLLQLGRCRRLVPLQLPLQLRRSPCRASTTARVTRKTDPNDQKAIEIRGTVRPFARSTPILRGLRVTGFYFGDNYIRDSERTRAVAQVTFEQNYINAGWDYINAHDQPSIAARDVQAQGWSLWATPKKPLRQRVLGRGVAALRSSEPGRGDERSRVRGPSSASRTGFPHQGNAVACTLMLDYDGQTFNNFVTRPADAEERSPSTDKSSFREIRTMKLTRTLLAVAAATTLVAGLAAQKIQIQGAGATFPNPIYQKWISEYNKLHPNVEINYQSLGSGAGIRQLTNQTVFFGASDGPMTNEQLQAAPGKILHFPTVLGADVPVYNLPGRQRRAQVHRTCSRRHLSRQDHQVERCGADEAQSRREPARRPTSRSCIDPTRRARRTSGWITCPRCRLSGR